MDVKAREGARRDVALILDAVRAVEGAGFLPPEGFLPFEVIDIGIDRRSPVSWQLYERHDCFPFTRELRTVTY